MKVFAVLLIFHLAFIITTSAVECDFSLPIVSNCEATLEDTLTISSTTLMEQADITCNTGAGKFCIRVTGGATVNMLSSSIHGNSVSQCIEVVDGNLNMDRSSVSYCHQGAVVGGSEDTNMTLVSCELHENTGSGLGAVAWSKGATLDVIDSSIKNTEEGRSLEGAPIYHESSSKTGLVTVSGCDFINNNGDNYGEAIRVKGPTIKMYNTKIKGVLSETIVAEDEPENIQVKMAIPKPYRIRRYN